MHKNYKYLYYNNVFYFLINKYTSEKLINLNDSLYNKFIRIKYFFYFYRLFILYVYFI